MFININYSKQPQKIKLHLAKPNKQIISHISEKIDYKLSVKLGNINELEFSIPYIVQDDDSMEYIINPHVDMIKEGMYIRVKLGSYIEWYIVDSIEESAEDTQTFDVKCFSLGYELKFKRINQLVEDSINAGDLLPQLLDETLWTIGEIDPLFNTMYRSFDSGSDSNALDCMLKAAETYGALIIWDTVNRKISFKDARENGQFRGMTVNYGKFLNSLKRSRTTEELTTRMYVFGNEDISIESVNPTGQPYIEDFSYFMYPFQRDENRNVIEHSYFMSDALCHALLDQSEAIERYAPQIKDLTDQMTAKQTDLVYQQSQLDELNLQIQNLYQLLDAAKATQNDTLISQRQSEINAKQTEINSQTAVVNGLQAEVDDIQNQIADLQNQILIDSHFTPELLDELKPYIRSYTWRDDRYIDPQELYDDAKKKFEEVRQPKVVIDISIENLLNIVEEQYYWDKLELGDLIKVKYPQMKIEYMAKIIQIDYSQDDINLTIANTTDLLNDMEKLIQVLYDNQSASTVLENNITKWNKVSEVQNQVEDLINSEYDANKRKITAGVNNQIEIGNRGILVKTPDNPDEMLIIQAGILALTKNGGDTWQTAITPDGILADRLIGRMVITENLYVENTSGTYTIDYNGFTIDSGALKINGGENGVSLDPTNGLMIQGDNNVTSIFNATDGFKFQVNGEDRFYYDPNSSQLVLKGNIQVTDLALNGDSILTNDGTQIDGSYIDKITTDQLVAGNAKISTAMIENLVVGKNVQMGANATISWNQVGDKPSIPQSAADIGALPADSSKLTYISSSGIYTGTISAEQIYGGTISGVNFNTISSNGHSISIKNGSLISKNLNSTKALSLSSGGLTIGGYFDGGTIMSELTLDPDYILFDLRSDGVDIYFGIKEHTPTLSVNNLNELIRDRPLNIDADVSFIGSVNFSHAKVTGLNTTARFA